MVQGRKHSVVEVHMAFPLVLKKSFSRSQPSEVVVEALMGQTQLVDELDLAASCSIAGHWPIALELLPQLLPRELAFPPCLCRQV